MIDNIIYGLGTLAFVVIVIFTLGFALLVFTGITLGMIESVKGLVESRKDKEQI